MVGSKAEQTIPSLIGLFSNKSENAKARYGAGRALAEICPGMEKVFLVIAGVLADKEEELFVRIGACSALRELHPKAKQVIPILIETFQNADEASDLRGAAAVGLAEMVYRWSLVAEKEKVMMLLTKALHDESEDVIVRSCAARSLGVADPRGKITCSILVEILQNKDEHELVRAGAILGIDKMFVVNNEAIPALNKVKEDGSIKLRRLAARALSNVVTKEPTKYGGSQNNKKKDQKPHEEEQ